MDGALVIASSLRNISICVCAQSLCLRHIHHIQTAPIHHIQVIKKQLQHSWSDSTPYQDVRPGAEARQRLAVRLVDGGSRHCIFSNFLDHAFVDRHVPSEDALNDVAEVSGHFATQNHHEPLQSAQVHDWSLTISYFLIIP